MIFKRRFLQVSKGQGCVALGSNMLSRKNHISVFHMDIRTLLDPILPMSKYLNDFTESIYTLLLKSKGKSHKLHFETNL